MRRKYVRTLFSLLKFEHVNFFDFFFLSWFYYSRQADLTTVLWDNQQVAVFYHWASIICTQRWFRALLVSPVHMGQRQEIDPGGINTPSQCTHWHTSCTLTLQFTVSIWPKHACYRGRKLTWRKPMQTQGEFVNSIQNSSHSNGDTNWWHPCCEAAVLITTM